MSKDEFKEFDAAKAWAQLKTAHGMIPCIIVDGTDGAVLMMAYQNEEAFALTMEHKRMYYYSRSRNSLWLKGETSGHFQDVLEARFDCDADCLLYTVKQHGVACHTGERSCFFRKITEINS